MSSNRTHNRAFEKAKQAFFEEGKRLDSEGSPAADCWICHKRIDYSVPPGTTDASHELDHYYPVRDYPDLQDDPAGFRHSHRKCNRERGAGQKRCEHARQADVPDDVCRRLLGRCAKGEGEHVGQADGGRADDDAEHRRASQQRYCGNHGHCESPVRLQGAPALAA